jgi:hypothetical protein
MEKMWNYYLLREKKVKKNKQLRKIEKKTQIFDIFNIKTGSYLLTKVFFG